MPEFIFRKTSELDEDDIAQITMLFNTVFDKDRTPDNMLHQYVNNPLGFSYHSLIVDNGNIVGMNVYVPVYYIVNGVKMLFANSIDSMVAKPYRDFFNYNDMVLTAYSNMKKEGVKFVYGYPNDNAYPVVIKSKLMKEIGKMHTYCLPLHIGGLKPSMRVLNPVSSILCRTFVSLSGIFASRKPDKYAIAKEEDSYNLSRYKRSNGGYNIEQIGGIKVYYKIKEHEGIRTAFLIDISEKSPKAFNIAVKHIIRNHGKSFDLLLYPGWLNFSNTSMIRIPRKFEPKNFNLTGKALDKKAFDETIWDIRNWDTNLSNYDLI